MSNAMSSLSSAMSSQTLSMQMACQSISMQKQQGALALQLIQSATAAVPQDPSTITPEQLKSPIDIRV
jgi:hypothetical protein